ncbi:hypothetical protein Emtol_3011 [Emticicia oligotrophica DSM 17448]|uniref:Uncharacterized protein n=2 Tax=Emticicia TaxID=312278 RepID=A0ABN4AP79_EMTOG|nr:hypothetical protein [Emticicia oligotrophica]AFK04144.1 hypothetical protein Emtol_3011 [Emticicia oligotrophica DSM 17448]
MKHYLLTMIFFLAEKFGLNVKLFLSEDRVIMNQAMVLIPRKIIYTLKIKLLNVIEWDSG